MIGKHRDGGYAEWIAVPERTVFHLPEWARTGKLVLDQRIIRAVPLDAGIINEVLDRLEVFGDERRVVITP